MDKLGLLNKIGHRIKYNVGRVQKELGMGKLLSHLTTNNTVNQRSTERDVNTPTTSRTTKKRPDIDKSCQCGI